MPRALDSMSQQILSQMPLHFACYAGDGEIVEILLSPACTLTTGWSCNNKDNYNEFTSAIIEKVISQEDSLNNWTPAHWAAYYGQVRLLL